MKFICFILCAAVAVLLVKIDAQYIAYTYAAPREGIAPVAPYLLQATHATNQQQQQQLPQRLIDAGRAQRSIYNGAWNEYGVGIAGGPIGVGHITKEELIALLDAWKEVEGQTTVQTKPQPAPEIDDEQSASNEQNSEQPEQTVDDDTPVAQTEGGSNRPLTVTLPAFVPIQLSAMYTPPQVTTDESSSFVPTASLTDPAASFDTELTATQHTLSAAKPTLFKLVQRPILPASRSVAKAPAITAAAAPVKPKAKSLVPSSIKTPKQSFYRSANPVAVPQSGLPTVNVPPPPPFLAHAPGPLQLVPSSQLYSNWH